MCWLRLVTGYFILNKKGNEGTQQQIKVYILNEKCMTINKSRPAFVMHPECVQIVHPKR